MPPISLIPSSFLPYLPRSTSTLHPLSPHDILGHIAILKELYLPPIHGGFDASDLFTIDDLEEVPDKAQSEVSKERRRRFSAGLAETMEGFVNGLNLDLDPDSTPEHGHDNHRVHGQSTPRGLGMVQEVSESKEGSINGDRSVADRDRGVEEEDSDRSDSSADSGFDYDDDEEEEDRDEDEDEGEGDEAHLDPFEREWAEKWLNGLVRRSQGWIEEAEAEEREVDEFGMGVRDVEAVLRDATAVLAMMAGTSAAGSLTRHLLFPIHDSLSPYIKALHSSFTPDPSMSPETTNFLASLATSPTSPITPFFKSLAPHSPLASTTAGVSASTRPISTSPVSGRSMPPQTAAGTGTGSGRRRASSAASRQLALSTSPETTMTVRSNHTTRTRRPSRSDRTDRSGRTGSTTRSSGGRGRGRQKRMRRRGVIPLLLHDAPMADHLSVGVQTWGSAILLGREISLDPKSFGLFPPEGAKRGIRILELGAGTGLLSILCRKLLTLYDYQRSASATAPATGSGSGSGSAVVFTAEDTGRGTGVGGANGDGGTLDKLEHVVVATDFHPDVLSNLKVCVDLNFPPQPQSQPQPQPHPPPSTAPHATAMPGVGSSAAGVHVTRLDWTTFPAMMMQSRSRRRQRKPSSSHEREEASDVDENDDDDDAAADAEYDLTMFEEPFDLVLASDCVYDPTHSELLNEVASWTLRLPDPSVPGDKGGTFHILSPLRPTFTPEIESIDTHFPVASALPSLGPLTPPIDTDTNTVQDPDPRPQSHLHEDLRADDRGRGRGLGRGLGAELGLRLATRGEGKRSVRGRKGEGRVDEVSGYWWWEVGWTG